MTPQFKAGDEVIFKREKLSKEWLIEFGTSAVYLTYKVTTVLGKRVFIKPYYGLAFEVDIDDIEIKPASFNQAKVIQPFIKIINELELTG